MDEFRRPFEYEEEKRGLLILFLIMITIVDGSVAIALTLQVYGIVKAVTAAGMGVIAAGILFLAYILYTAVYCYRLKENSARVGKAYLVIRALYIASCIMAVYLHNAGNEALIGNGPMQYSSVKEFTMIVLVYPMAYTIAFSIIWFIYFSKSRRFRKDGAEAGGA